MRAGVAVLVAAYLGMAVARARCSSTTPSRCVLAVDPPRRRSRCSCSAARGVDPSDRAGFTRFYMRVWQLFFLEYAIVPISCLAG